MIPSYVYSEITPNPNTMKFVADRMIVEGSYEFIEPEEVTGITLLERLYKFPFVDALFISGNFIAISKNDLVEWDDVTGELRTYIQDYLKEHQWVMEPRKEQPTEDKTERGNQEDHKDVQLNREELSEMETKIVDLLDEYVKPAVEQDGGAILFKHFEPSSGKLTVQMKGACNGCPSSTVTLKSGIEQLFNKMLPEVKEVVAEE